MTDLQRDIGGLEARMDEHEKRVDRIEGKIDEGFARLHERLDELAGAEHQRKGALGLLKLLFSGSVITGLWEAGKAFLNGGHK